MLCLRKFIFHISTEVELHHLADYSSNEDIEQTNVRIEYQQVCCLLHYVIHNVICYVFSLPSAFGYLGFIGNTFPLMDFNRVRQLEVHDKIPFKHEFLIRIVRFFPLLKSLSVINLHSQPQMRDNSVSNNNELHSVVEYPNLVSLDLQYSHIDYIEQFQSREKHIYHI